MTETISKGALVRWNNGAQQRWGVVSDVTKAGKCIAVHLDGGDNLTFAWPSETVEHVLLDTGQSVKLTATGDRGVVSARIPSDGRVFYSVSLADGGNRTVTEDGV